MAEHKPGSAHQRRDLILLRLKRNGAVRVNELTSVLHVSDMTVRRDLDELARRGAVTKVHGGAILRGGPARYPFDLNAKPPHETAWDASIARAAAGLVKAGDTIALAAGTATTALARKLRSTPDLTVVTNSTHIADVLRPSADMRRTVVLTGGSRTPSGALVGPVAERAIRSLHVNTLFIGCHGVDPDAGLTTSDLSESETSRQFIRAAHRTVVVADHTKWGTAGPSHFADMHDIDVLVCDAGLDPAARAIAIDLTGRLVIATTPTDGMAD